MILLDANVLLYAYDARAEGHAKVRQWLEDASQISSPCAWLG